MFVLVGLFSAQSVDAITFSARDTIDSTGTVFRIYDSQINSDGIYVLYKEETTAEIFLAFSDDEGATWTITSVESSGDHNESAGLVFDENDNVGVIYYINSVGDSEIHFRNSTDNGATFNDATNIVLDNVGATIGELSFDGDGQNIAVSFTDQDSQEFVGVVVSNNFGATWNGAGQGDAVILQGETDGCEDCFFIDHEASRIKVHGMNIYAIWGALEDATGEFHEYFTRSTDNGLTFDTPIQVSDAEVDTINQAVNLQEVGGKILVSWQDQGSVPFYALSENGGVSFATPVELDDATFCDGFFDVEVQGDDVVWVCDDAGGVGGASVNHSEDFTTTFDGWTGLNGTQIVNDLQFSESVNVESTGNNFYFLFQDGGEIDPNSPVVLSYSQDSGASWQYTDFIVGMNNTSVVEAPHENEGQHQGFTSMFEDIWFWVFSENNTDLEFIISTIANSGTTPPDSTAPVIELFSSQPIQIIEDAVFDDFEHVFCLDDTDGDISMMMDIAGDTVNTGNRGSYFVDYTCTDVASNEDTLQVHYIVVKKSGGSGGSLPPTVGSGGSSSPLAVDGVILKEVPQLKDIPVLSVTTLDDLDRVEEIQQRTGQIGSSIGDLFANLFSQRLDADSGERVDFAEIINDRVNEVRDTSLGEASDTISDRASPVADFFRNLFSNFFN